MHRLRTRPALPLLGMLLSFAAPTDPAHSKPRQRRAGNKAVKTIVVGKAYITPARRVRRRKGPGAKTTGGPPPPPKPGASDVTNDTNGKFKFVLSANTPFVPFAGRLLARYPRNWQTSGNGGGPGGLVWLSDMRLPGESYAEAKIFVEPGHTYDVKLCAQSTSADATVRATVGGAVTTFSAGFTGCDITLKLIPKDRGWTTVKIDFADADVEKAFAIERVEVVRS